mgnify:CR=1 FL=1
MDPFDMVMAVVPTLNEKQKQEVADLLNASPCTVRGHKYKKVGEVDNGFWKPKVIISICEKCGNEIRTQGK